MLNLFLVQITISPRLKGKVTLVRGLKNWIKCYKLRTVLPRATLQFTAIFFVINPLLLGLGTLSLKACLGLPIAGLEHIPLSHVNSY